MNEDPLNKEQWAAARMLVARLRSEAAREDFDFGALGVEWLATDDVVCAVTDEGDLLHLGDLFYAAVVMLWSLVVAQAEEEGVHPLDVVSRLGLGLALLEPS